MRNARYHRTEDDWCDHHLDQLDEAVAECLDPVIGRMIGPQHAKGGAKHDRDEHLDIENLVPGFSRAGRRRACNRCRHDCPSPRAFGGLPVARCADRPDGDTAKFNWVRGVNGTGSFFEIKWAAARDWVGERSLYRSHCAMRATASRISSADRA